MSTFEPRDPSQVAIAAPVNLGGASPWADIARATAAVPKDDGKPGRRYLFGDVVRVYIASTPHSRDPARTSTLDMWCEVFTGRHIDEITTGDIQAALDVLAITPIRKYAGRDRTTGERIYRSHGLRKPATLQRYVSLLSVIFKFAQRRPTRVVGGWQRMLATDHVNPCDAIPAFESAPQPDRTLDKQEVASLLAHARAAVWPKLYLFTLMLLTTGARRSEVLTLRGDQLNLVGATPTATLQRTKNDTARLLYLTPVVVTEIRRLGVPGPGEFLFPAARQRPGKAPAPYKVEKVFVRLLARAGISNARLHDLRHTVGGRLADEGREALEIAELLGHKDLRSTARYAHRSVAARQRMVDDSAIGSLR